MEPVDQSKSNKIKRYCCSNPNCNKVFSKPKIIKYYVCPSCQTLVDEDSYGFHSPTQETAVQKKKQTRRLKGNKQEIVSDPQAVELPQSDPAPINDELVSAEKLEVDEEPEKMMPAPIEVLDTLDSDYNLQNSQDVPEKQTQSSDSECLYFFGYLSQRDKSEGVPVTCFVCSKSIECMLQEYNKSEDSVKEIKKWYSL